MMKKLSEFKFSDAVVEVLQPNKSTVVFRIQKGPSLFGVASTALLELAYDLATLFRTAYRAIPELVERSDGGGRKETVQ